MLTPVSLEEQAGQLPAASGTESILVHSPAWHFARHYPRLLADYALPCRRRTFTMATTLTLATTAEELRASLQRFNDEAKAWDYASQLVRTTQYWVRDEKTGQFGPSKFVAFAGMTALAYDEARRHNATGAYFDGGATRRAIEKLVGEAFESSASLAEELVRWSDGLLGDGLSGADRGRWKFVVIR